jgi:hypothetical protein
MLKPELVQKVKGQTDRLSSKVLVISKKRYFYQPIMFTLWLIAAQRCRYLALVTFLSARTPHSWVGSTFDRLSEPVN